MATSTTRPLRPGFFRRYLAWAQLRAALAGRPRRVTAMVRVRDEEEFVEPAVLSIAEVVDHVVLVDNLSRDRTPTILERLAAALPGKADRYAYPHEIARVGSESRALAATPDDPRTSAAYYNWCLQRCHTPYVLKWDGDMIATEVFVEEMNAWRHSSRLSVIFSGLNVYPDRRHAIAAAESELAALSAMLDDGGGVPAWVTDPARDYPEPRLFPRWHAQYEMELGWTQRLSTPATYRRRARQIVTDPCYLHMKFCKRDPLSNYSPELAQLIDSNIVAGARLSSRDIAVLERCGLNAT